MGFPRLHHDPRIWGHMEEKDPTGKRTREHGVLEVTRSPVRGLGGGQC